MFDKPLEDYEYPEPDSDDDDTPVVACSSCGAEVYEDAVQCPVCGDYLTPETNALSGRSGWWIAIGVAGVVAVVVALLRR